jgi:ribonuclease I
VNANANAQKRKKSDEQKPETHINQIEKPLNFYILLLSWSPLVEVPP